MLSIQIFKKKIKKSYLKKIIVYQILFMFQQKVDLKKEVLRLIIKYGLIIIWIQQKKRMLI